MNLANFYKNLPYLLIVSAFGMYIGGGLRLEHMVLYPSAILFFFLAVLKEKKIMKNYALVCGLWFVSTIIIGMVTLGKYDGQTEITVILADVESFIQPLVLMSLFIFVPFVQKKEEISIQLQKASKVLIFMLILNTFFIFASILTDTTKIGNLFWGSGGEDWSVASLSMTNGRYSGIFNQPMEAGIMYSIGLLTWLYLADKMRKMNFKYILALLLMITGGLVTVSKIFLFGGLFLFFIGVLLNKTMWRLIFTLTFWSVLFGFSAYYFLLKTWIGLDYLLRFFGSNENIVYLISAGRYGGAQAQQANYFNEVWKESPLFGNGLGVTPVYDSAFFSFFATGGILNLALYILIIIILLYMGIKFMQQNGSKSEFKLYLGLVLLIIGASLGSPILTLNRVAIVLWVFLGFLFQFIHIEKIKSEEHFTS